MKSKLLALFVLMFFLSGCAHHQALIQTDPPGAMVTINGTEVGITPVQYDYSLSSGSLHQMHISQQGYEPVDQTIKADKTNNRHETLAGCRGCLEPSLDRDIFY